MCVPSDFDQKVCPQFFGPTETPSASFKCRGFPIKASADPNDKAGTPGATPAQFLINGVPLSYTIHFENQATATAPAQTVVITDPLNPQLVDFSTFSLGPITFGAIRVPLAAGVSHYTGGVDLRPEQNLLVLIDAGLDPQSGIVTWRLTSVDPLTLQLTTDPSAGFLPPNTNPPAGEGTVLFTVDPQPGLATGTQIANQATVVFDVNVPIPTPTWTNTIDTTPPASQVTAAVSTPPAGTLAVAWSGSDQGSGIRTFTIFVSADGGPFTPGLVDVTSTSGAFVGQCGHTYGFYSVATDNVGNVESPPAGPQVTAAACAEDTGFVPPTKVIAKCENTAAKNLATLGTAITACHGRAAAALVTGTKLFDEEGCEQAARTKYDAAATKLVGCPACLDGAGLATQADRIAARLDADAAALYCAGTRPFGGDDAGFVPPTKAVLKCTSRAAHNVAKLTACLAACHLKAGAEALKGKAFAEEACERTAPTLSCRAKYDTSAAKLLRTVPACPPCLDAAHQAMLADQTEQSVDAANGGVYCAGTTPFGSASGVPRRGQHGRYVPER